ncbi:MAG: enoyl-CoA hydratase/isomerase family protein [Ilumatobacteraceae bacterium]
MAHVDVEAILRFPTGSPPATELNAYHEMCETLRTMPKATIAVIEGRAGGGGSELALSCAMRFAALPSPGRAGAGVYQPEVALGIIPGGSGTQRLARLMGRSRALEAVLGCDDVDAELAERWGWVNRSLPADEVWPFVERLARRIASFPAHAVAAAKASVVRVEKEVREDLLAEGNAFSATLGGPGAREAMEKFLADGGQTREGEMRLGSLFD